MRTHAREIAHARVKSQLADIADTRAYTRTQIANNFYICKKIHKKTQKTLYFAFFLITIRFYSQKYSTFAQNLKNGTKIQQIFCLTK